MNKTRIEWCDYTLNPVKGLCPMACSYCYARRMYKRFKWNPEIRLDWENTIDALYKTKAGDKIFWGSTMELFGEWIKPNWIQSFIKLAELFDDRTHIFLTKQPENLKQFSPFPKNCWVGASATNHQQYINAVKGLREIEASVEFLSLEPLLHKIDTSYDTFDLVIVGQQTPINKLTMPKLEWIDKIVKDADYLGTPVFLKNNLNSCVISDYPRLLDKQGNLRQEFPKER